MKLTRKNLFLGATAAITVALSAPCAYAVDYYWDTNGITTGAGNTIGQWGIDPFWSTDPTGESATANTTITGVDDVFFSAGTDNSGVYNPTLGNSVTARKITFEEGTVSIGTVSGANAITLAGGGGITVNTTTVSGAAINSNFTINGNNTFNVGAGRALTLNSTAFTRGTRATLNVQGSGTVTSTAAGLGAADIVNGIVGPWASIGTGTGTRYATFTGNDITALTGTAAATAANVTSTLGTFNYDVAAVGTLAAGASINTLRYAGAAGTIAGDLTTKGIMNTGGGTLTFSGAVTSGTAATEMVVNAANGGVTFSGVLTGTIVKTGSGTMTLGAAAQLAANLPNMTVNEGVLITNTSTADGLGGATINSGGTLRWGAGGRHGNGAVFTINAGGTLDVQANDDLIGAINGAGTITGTTGRVQLQAGTSNFTGLIEGSGLRFNLQRDGAATVTLSGLNTYGGTTNIQRGTLNINTIKSVSGGASAIGAPVTAANGTIAMGSGTFAGTLVYTGTGDETDRVINLAGANGGAILNQSGASGLLKFTSAFTSTIAGSKTLILQGSTAGTGEISGAIVDNGTAGTTALASAFTTTPTSTITLGSVKSIALNATISGTGIQNGTTITNINTATNVVTLSLPTNGTAGALNQTMTVTGVTNTTAVTKAGSGTWTLSGPNTYSGGTTIGNNTQNVGTLNITHGSALGTGPVSIVSNFGTGFFATLTLNSASGITVANNFTTSGEGQGNNGIIRNVSGNNEISGTVTLGGGGGSTRIQSDGGSLTLSNAIAPNTTLRNLTLSGSATGTVSGAINDGAGANTLAGLIKQGSGTWTLSGINGYTGATTVSAGTLLINGNSSTAVGAVAVNAGTLGGTGRTGGAVTVAGAAILSPGASIESLDVASLSMTSNSVFTYEVASNGVAGADLLASRGTLSLTGVTLNLDIPSLTALGGGGWTNGNKLTLISYLGADITSGFTGYADDTNYAFGSNIWRFDYNDTVAGDNFAADAIAGGQDRFVTLTVIPEPNVAALIGAFGAILLIRRRR